MMVMRLMIPLMALMGRLEYDIGCNVPFVKHKRVGLV